MYRIPTLITSVVLLSSSAIGQHSQRASVDSLGAQSNGAAFAAALSTTGRYVAFVSAASNLVPFDTNGTWDVFVHDSQLGTTRRVSVDSAGLQLNGASGVPPFSPSELSSELAISGDGRRIAFLSEASNLPGSVNFATQVYVRDLEPGTTILASVNLNGGGASDGADSVVISGDGRHVVFTSRSIDLVVNDITPNTSDIYVRDLSTQTTVLLASASSTSGNSITVSQPCISQTGRYVAFHRFQQFTSPTFFHIGDIFVVDRDSDADGVFDELGATSTINVTQSGPDVFRFQPSISATGRYLTYLDGQQTIYRYDRDADGDGVLDEPGATSEQSWPNPFQGASPTYPRSPITSDGRYFAYLALPPGSQVPPIEQLVIHDVLAGTDRIVSYGSTTGEAAQNEPGTSVIALCADGSRAAYDCLASNLVPNDTNAVADVFLFRLDQPDCLGTGTYCTGAPNSVGLGALIGWAGSLSIADDNFVLTATGLPPNTAGLFLYGPDQQQVPFGNGYLCVAPGSAGLFRIGAAQANALGQVVRPLYLHAPPMNGGPGAVGAGSAWNFQFWYRNPAGGGAGFNTTDALRAVFCP